MGGIIETVFCNAIVTAHQIDINKYIVKEEVETTKPQEKPVEKENKPVEDPEEELIEDDIDGDNVDDPDDEVIEIESNKVKTETPTTSSACDQPQPQTRQVIEVDENDV